MTPSWKTLAEVAAARNIKIEKARALVDASNCPKVFGLHGTTYLI